MRLILAFVFILFFSVDVQCVEPIIAINGMQGSVTCSASDPVTLSLSLKTDYHFLADWWLVVEASPYGLFYYDAYMGRWSNFSTVSDLRPSYQGPLFSFKEFVLSLGPLPEGHYAFYFGVDRSADGFLNWSLLSYAMAELWVLEPDGDQSSGDDSSGETLWFEDWEKSPRGRYLNGYTFKGEISNWTVLDSSGLSGCSYLKDHEAIIAPAQSSFAQGQSLILYSYHSNHDLAEYWECGDNVEVYTTHVLDHINSNTYFSACVSGYLTGSDDDSAIYILFTDQNDNELLYIFANNISDFDPDGDTFCWTDEEEGEHCYEVFLGMTEGCFTRNLYEDFAAIPGVNPSRVQIRAIELAVDEHGMAEFDNLRIFRR